MNRFHLIRRSDVSIWKKLLYYLIGIVFSLLLGGVFLKSLGINPLRYYRDMATIGLIGNYYPAKSVEGLLKLFVPLLITSLALSLSFKMRFWNIGGEGEFITGAIFAAIVAFKLGDSLPGPVVILLMCIAAFISAGVIGFLTAHLRVRFNTNETLVTLMINYIMLYIIKYIGETKADWNFFLRTDSERPMFAKFPDAAIMKGIKIGSFNLLYSVIIALLIAVVVYIYLRSTKHGYEVAVVGDSVNTAKYSGINVYFITVRTVFLSAAMIGLAGAFTAASSGTISTDITNNVGWTGVIVAWLSKLSTPVICIVSLLISVLQYGCQAASASYSQIDHNFADLMQGIFLFAILAADFAVNFKVVRTGSKKDA
ncbi:MAG: ABC transporter permease [Clostridiales bacterium]|nr:ABC transporter permease [Clostridiales bacterium]